jgi:hypothetical protein
VIKFKRELSYIKHSVLASPLMESRSGGFGK